MVFFEGVGSLILRDCVRLTVGVLEEELGEFLKGKLVYSVFPLGSGRGFSMGLSIG